MTPRSPGAGMVHALRRARVRVWLARYPLLGATGAALVVVAWIFVAHGREEFHHGRTLVTPVEALSYDLPFLLQTRGRAQEQAWLLEISPASFTAQTDRDNDGRIDRDVLADLLTRLASLNPRLVLLDFLLSDVRDPESARLIAALRSLATNTPVVLATSTLGPAERVHPAFLETGALVGVADVDNQPGNTVRLLPGRFAMDAPPSLAWVAAAALAAPVTREARADELRWLNYYGPGRAVFERLDLREFLEATPESLARLKGRLVFVGFAPPLEGFRNPAQDGPIGGAEVHATALLNLLQQDWLRPLPVAWQITGFLGYALWLGLLLGRHRNRSGWLLTLLSTAILTGLAAASQRVLGVWWWWIIPVLQAPVAVLAGLIHPGYAAFISYRTSDAQETALALEQGLLARGLHAYLAPGSIDLAAPFADELLRRIRRTPGFLLVLSEEARRELRANHGWVAREVQAACDHRRTIIVVRPLLRPDRPRGDGPAGIPQPTPPLNAGELPDCFKALADLESVVLETGEHRQAGLDKICRRLG